MVGSGLWADVVGRKELAGMVESESVSAGAENSGDATGERTVTNISWSEE